MEDIWLLTKVGTQQLRIDPAQFEQSFMFALFQYTILSFIPTTFKSQKDDSVHKFFSPSKLTGLFLKCSFIYNFGRYFEGRFSCQMISTTTIANQYF